MPRILHVWDEDPMSLDQAQEYVGGLIQIIELPEGDQMVINEEGKCIGLPINERATAIAHNAQAIFPRDVIVGNAMILYGRSVLP